MSTLSVQISTSEVSFLNLKFYGENREYLKEASCALFFKPTEFKIVVPAKTKTIQVQLYRTCLKIWFWTEAKALAVGAIATSPVLEIRASCDRPTPSLWLGRKSRFSNTFGINRFNQQWQHPFDQTKYLHIVNAEIIRTRDEQLNQIFQTKVIE